MSDHGVRRPEQEISQAEHGALDLDEAKAVMEQWEAAGSWGSQPPPAIDPPAFLSEEVDIASAAAVVVKPANPK